MLPSKPLGRETALQLLSRLLPEETLRVYFPDHPPAELRRLIAGELDLLETPALQDPPLPASGVQPCRLYTDGASRGNPGEAGAGIVLQNDKGEELLTRSAYLGQMTNNAAEYHALILGLDTALELGCTEIAIFLDSELIVRQIQGDYKVKHQTLQPLFSRVRERLPRFTHWQIQHIPRTQNSRADKMANQGIDSRQQTG